MGQNTELAPVTAAETQPGTVTEYLPVELDDADEQAPRCRIWADGHARFNLAGTGEFAKSGTEQGRENLFRWVRIVEGRTSGNYYLVPTAGGGRNRVKVAWVDAGKNAEMRLRKLLQVKGIKIPRGHALVMGCLKTNLPDDGAALELQFKDAALKKVGSRRKAEAAKPTA